MDQVFSYFLPQELIAQEPVCPRDRSRLMVVDRRTGLIEHRVFSEIGDYFQRGDLLVLNDAKVICARLRGKKETGGNLEVFLLKKHGEKEWEVLLRGKPSAGKKFIVGRITGKVIQKTSSGSWLVTFDCNNDQEILKLGEIPLPPYIKRPVLPQDWGNYQTVYAAKDGAVAAPTAGLHFTRELLATLKQKGVSHSFLTLFIGWSSFKPVRQQDYSIPSESFELSESTAQEINETRMKGGRVIAVGTSTVRALESAVVRKAVIPLKATTSLFIKPGFNFQIVNALITNFHLPGSTHLYLVCALAGKELMEKAYSLAVKEKYRFYSYGDAMLIL
ncbi:MAG: tRNA preQ1(34) S-adenosylmethionine ribosyltransferase-isomerase QueA [Candidatus Omnitrophica bacterium]|nr:tRNA preQ1(34) S-adenosylmethionine ribosyltransferase-isomerase QueA [Candidatus Omnitrophota bacterium]